MCEVSGKKKLLPCEGKVDREARVARRWSVRSAELGDADPIATEKSLVKGKKNKRK
jgi:hypothetical protein